MQVETYEVEEIKGELGVMAADSEALELIEKLGLTGQKQLAVPQTGTRQPYRQLTQQEHNVFGVLFPEHTKLEAYAQGPIPLRVLQVAAHANEIGLFKHLEVWHPSSPAEKDPALIGVAQHPEWSWSTQEFLLARWGDPLLTFDGLVAKAHQIWLQTTEPALQALKSKIDFDLANLKAHAARAFLSGGELPNLTYQL